MQQQKQYARPPPSVRRPHHQQQQQRRRQQRQLVLIPPPLLRRPFDQTHCCVQVTGQTTAVRLLHRLHPTLCLSSSPPHDVSSHPHRRMYLIPNAFAHSLHSLQSPHPLHLFVVPRSTSIDPRTQSLPNTDVAGIAQSVRITMLGIILAVANAAVAAASSGKTPTWLRKRESPRHCCQPPPQKGELSRRGAYYARCYKIRSTRTSWLT